MKRPTTPRRAKGGLRVQRKPGESLVFFVGGERIEVVVSSVGPGSVRLRVDAEAEVKVWRGELPQARGVG